MRAVAVVAALVSTLQSEHVASQMLLDELNTIPPVSPTTPR
jgi:hypothetical protein